MPKRNSPNDINEIDDLKEFEIIKLPENVDFYPYSVAQLIIKNLE